MGDFKAELQAPSVGTRLREFLIKTYLRKASTNVRNPSDGYRRVLEGICTDERSNVVLFVPPRRRLSC